MQTFLFKMRSFVFIRFKFHCEPLKSQNLTSKYKLPLHGAIKFISNILVPNAALLIWITVYSSTILSYFFWPCVRKIEIS
jgi:hypothetical protein